MKASTRLKTKLQKLRAVREEVRQDKTRRFRELMERIIPNRACRPAAASTSVSAEWLNGLMAIQASLLGSSATIDAALLPDQDQQSLQCLELDDSRSTEPSASVTRQEDHEP